MESHDLSDPSALFFQGSIAEAINRAQANNFVLVVFVAGDNEESVSLELTTFTNSAVLDEVKKQSLMLRLQEGSADAKNFSAIFPIRRVPTITFIGYKGSLLQQLEGYQEAEAFLTALRHAVATFNAEVQRAVASAMVAFLSTANNLTASDTPSAPEPQSAGNSTVLETPVSSSPSTEAPSAASEPLVVLPTQPEESSKDVDLTAPTEATRSVPEARLSPDARPSTAGSLDELDTGGSANSSAPASAPVRSGSQDSRLVQKEASTGVKPGNGKKIPLRREPSAPKPVRIRTGPFLLQVRLTNGETIQGSFDSYQLLRDVKNFVDLQRTDGNWEFQLAVPFPRKVFTEEDMDKTLSKLDIGPRSALILISKGNLTGTPYQAKASAENAAVSSSQSEPNSAGGSYVGRFLSFFSPYVYGRSAASQDQDDFASASHNDGVPTTSRALRQGPQPSMVNSSRPEPPFMAPHDAGSNQENSALSGRLNQRRGGSGNVHTLRGRDDDGAQPGNTYWNGNSTQFGGRDDAKED